MLESHVTGIAKLYYFALRLTLVFWKLEIHPCKNSNRKRLQLVLDSADTRLCHRDVGGIWEVQPSVNPIHVPRRIKENKRK